MIEFFELIWGIIGIALFITLLVGLMKPALIMRWSSKPTRIKFLGWWLLSMIVIFTLLDVIEPDYPSDVLVEKAKSEITKGNYNNAIGHLKKIKQEDVLYSEAQTLIANANEGIAKQKAEEEARKKAEVEAKAEAQAKKKAEADAKRLENERNKAEADARKKEEADAKAAERASSTSTSNRGSSGNNPNNPIGRWEPLLTKTDGGNTDIEWIDFNENGTCKLSSVRQVEARIIGHSDKIFDGTWVKKKREAQNGIYEYIEIIYKYKYEYVTKPVRVGTLNGQPWYDSRDAGKIIEEEKIEKYFWRDGKIYASDNFHLGSEMKKAK